jgi:Planctomycete cytochrome C
MHNPRMTLGKRAPASVALLFSVAVAIAAGLGLGGCGSTDDRPAKWSFISATIMEPSCATVNCHSAIAQRAGIDMHDRASGYTSLVIKGFVVPNNADASTLFSWLHGQGAMRMPPDIPLPQADIDLIGAWVTAGATNN